MGVNIIAAFWALLRNDPRLAFLSSQDIDDLASAFSAKLLEADWIDVEGIQFDVNTFTREVYQKNAFNFST